MLFTKNTNYTDHLFPDLKELLLSSKLMNAQSYNNCEQQAKQYNQSIEDYLYKSGLIPHQVLQKAIAISQNLNIEFVNPQQSNSGFQIEQSLCCDNGYNLIDNYARLNCIHSTEKTPDSNENIGFSESESPAFTYPDDASKFITARDFRNLFISQNHQQLNHQAANLLDDKTPNLTAKHGMYFLQKIILIGLFLMVLVAVITQPTASYYYLSVTLSCIFLFASIVKIYSLFLPKTQPQENSKAYLELKPCELPIYSILVPLFKEANLVEQLTNNLMNLNYPRSKLDIKLLFERDDIETIAAAKQLDLPECFEFIIVQPSQPQTKPKAMNFALPFVRGEFVTIYDAEDRPEPEQLLKAITKFKQEDSSLACLQSSLEYENWNENWLARHFFIEYATHFNRFLPALERLKIPLPLGGTSNHFKTAILREVGGWDAYNVTEDADLGIRLSLYGYRSGILNSITLEEANHQLIPWLLQRTRWLKGWLQTVIVHSRHPKNLLAAIGPLRYLGFLALTSGIIFSSLMHPLIFISPFIVYFTFDLATIMNSNLHMFLFLLCGFTLIVGYGAAFLTSYQAIAEFKRWRLLLTLISAPIYWLLISIAAWNAIRDYIKDPFYWAKTEHGVSKYLNQKAAAE